MEAGAAPAPAQQSTWRCKRSWTVLILVTVLGLAIDLASKSLAFRYVAGTPVEINRDDIIIRHRSPSDQIPFHAPVVVIPRLLEFTLVANRGAVFGMGAGRRELFIGFTI